MSADEPQEEMLLEILKNGERIKLGDASIWLINPGDIPTVCTWIPTAIIKIDLVEPDAMFSYELTNTNIDVSVRGMKET